ncbi:MAG: hypothetical protein ABI947_25930 [Chloroflexota bacterium]
MLEFRSDDKDEMPAWMQRTAWSIFIGVLIIGVITVILLASGAADPPKAGLLIWDSGPFTAQVNPKQSVSLTDTFPLPYAAYTLEVTGSLSHTSDSLAAWGIAFADTAHVPFSVFVNGYRFFSMSPAQPDFTPFIHLRADSNKITLDVDKSGWAVVRLNDEIAWRGQSPPSHQIAIRFQGGDTRSAQFVIQHIAVYALETP